MPFRVKVNKMCYSCYVEIDASSKIQAEGDALQLALDGKLKWEEIPKDQQYTATVVPVLPFQNVM